MGLANQADRVDVADPEQFPDSAIRHTTLVGSGGGAGGGGTGGGSLPVGGGNRCPSGAQPPLGRHC